MLRILRFAFATLVTLAVAGAATTAFAAPVGWQSVDVTLHTEEQQSTLLVSGELPASTKLPFETELAVPAGTKLQWIGELLGGPPGDDPSLEYVKSTVRGMDVYRFTLTKSRTAQVEGVSQAASALDGANYATALEWTAWRALPVVNIGARIPSGARIEQPAPGAALQASEAGYGYYTKTVKNPKAGEVLDLTFSYALPAGSSASGAANAGSGTDTAAVVMVLAVFLGGLFILAFSVRRKMVAKAAGDTDEVDEAAGGTAFDAGDAAVEPHEDRPEAGDRPTRRIKPAVAVLGVVAVLAIGVAAAIGLATSTPTVDGKITKFFGAASPCTSASIQVVANQGVDLGTQGMQLIDAFTGQPDIGNVTLDIARSTVDVDFCESSHTAASIGQILAGTGLVTVAAAPAGSATGTTAPDTSGQ